MVLRAMERALLHCSFHHLLTCPKNSQSSSLLWALITYVSADVEVEVEKISESVLNKVSNLDLVNIVDLRAMD